MIDHDLFAVFCEVILVEGVGETGVLFGIVDGDGGIELTLVFPLIDESATRGLMLGYEDNTGFYVYTYSTIYAISGCFEETLGLF